MMLLAKLLLAHLVGDFILQPDSWIKEKEIKKLRSPKLYWHSLIHGVLTMLLVWDIQLVLPVLAIMFAHGFIDALKLLLQKEKNRRRWFLIDQVLHIIVILIIWRYWDDTGLDLNILPKQELLILLTAIIFLTNPSSVIIKIVISHWTPDTMKADQDSLPDAGKFIGFLERLLVMAFIMGNHWEGVGFLLAAKSIFRFGDLKDAQDRKLTEYVLIGTFLSFGIAMCVGILTSMLIGVSR